MKKTTILILTIIILICILIKVYSPTKNVKLFSTKTDSSIAVVDTILLDSITIDSISLDTL